MPSFYISSFAFSKNPRENQKRGRSRGRRKQSLSDMSRARSIVRGCSLFSRASAFIRNKQGLHTFRLHRKCHGWQLTQRHPPGPLDSPSAPLRRRRRLAGLVPQGRAALWRDHNGHKMDGGNTIHPPALPSSPSSPQKRRGEGYTATPRLQTSCFAPHSPPSPWCHM